MSSFVWPTLYAIIGWFLGVLTTTFKENKYIRDSVIDYLYIKYLEKVTIWKTIKYRKEERVLDPEYQTVFKDYIEISLYQIEGDDYIIRILDIENKKELEINYNIDISNAKEAKKLALEKAYRYNKYLYINGFR